MQNKQAKKKALESLFNFLKDEGKQRMQSKKMGVSIQADSKEELIKGIDKAKKIVEKGKDEDEDIDEETIEKVKKILAKRKSE